MTAPENSGHQRNHIPRGLLTPKNHELEPDVEQKLESASQCAPVTHFSPSKHYDRSILYQTQHKQFGSKSGKEFELLGKIHNNDLSEFIEPEVLSTGHHEGRSVSMLSQSKSKRNQF